MHSFLRIEERSHLLGSNQPTVVFVPLSEVHKVLVVDDGVMVWHGTPTEHTHAAKVQVIDDIGEAFNGSSSNLIG